MNLDDWGRRAERQVPWIRRAAWLVLVLGLVSCNVRGADRPADPVVVLAPSTTAEGGPVRTLLAGFEEIPFRITTPDGRELDWCALLAATEAARARGLMQQRDLLGYDAMVFRFDEPSRGGFYMFETVLPLSIAWFDEGGVYVSQADMDPCPEEDPGACPTFPPAAPALHALEVARGGLGALGVVPGSRLSFPEGPCA